MVTPCPFFKKKRVNPETKKRKKVNTFRNGGTSSKYTQLSSGAKGSTKELQIDPPGEEIPNVMDDPEPPIYTIMGGTLEVTPDTTNDFPSIFGGALQVQGQTQGKTSIAELIEKTSKK